MGKNIYRISSNTDKTEGSIKHAYKLLDCTYFYIFSIVDKVTVIVDYIGKFKAEATDKITNLQCGRGYQDDFNLLLKANRTTTIWSSDKRFVPFYHETKPGDTFEVHKHPFKLTGTVNKGESFEWITKSRYTINTPSKETIDETRKKHFWYSHENQFQFYDNIHAVANNYSFYLFAPKWMKEFDSSATVDAKNITKPTPEKELLEKGIIIKRKEINTNPQEILKQSLPPHLLDFSYMNNPYYGMSTTVTVKEYQPSFFDIALLFGFEMPAKNIWEFHLANHAVI